MKLSRIFYGLLLFVACATPKLIESTSPITKIDNNKVFFSDGNNSLLPIKKSAMATVIYLVRHAEKAKEGGRDPLLTSEGTERAERLKNILLNAQIDEVYSTEYKRTQLTAAPLATAIGKTIQSYNPRALTAFANQLKDEHKGKRILIAGHSNTTPTLTNALLSAEKFPMLDETQYDHLFVVTIDKEGKAQAMDLRY